MLFVMIHGSSMVRLDLGCGVARMLVNPLPQLSPLLLPFLTISGICICALATSGVRVQLPGANNC